MARRTRLRLLHCAAGQPVASIWNSAFLGALDTLGTLQLAAQTSAWSEARMLAACRGADVLLTGWGSRPLPAALAEDPGQLRYVCHLTGTLRDIVPVEVVRSSIPVTNWGDAPAGPVAETALTLLLACLKNVRPHIECKLSGGWVEPSIAAGLGSMEGLRVGLYGFGFIARRFARLAAAMGAVLLVFDPRAEGVPDGICRVGSLEELFAACDAVSIHAPLTEETRGTVTAGHLARLPEGGIVVNTARGAILEEKALFAELARGRLRAGLDVLSTDESPLAADHPARTWPNLILTAHTAGLTNWPGHRDNLKPLHKIALENLRRFTAGEPLRFVMDAARYGQST